MNVDSLRLCHAEHDAKASIILGFMIVDRAEQILSYHTSPKSTLEMDAVPVAVLTVTVYSLLEPTVAGSFAIHELASLPGDAATPFAPERVTAHGFCFFMGMCGGMQQEDVVSYKYTWKEEVYVDAWMDGWCRNPNVQHVLATPGDSTTDRHAGI